MRGHGKVAVLKDDEVDRLERAAAAASGPSREDVMDSMYGRANPKPKGKKSKSQFSSWPSFLFLDFFSPTSY
jgi:hypothetical protein